MKLTGYDTIIVGGGIAGLTSAAYLARAGKKILLIEKNNEFGGLVSSFKRNGFYFEAGARSLESAGVILPMLDDLGIRIATVRSKVSLGIENEIISIEDLRSVKDYTEMLVRLFPESKAEIYRFIKEMRKIMNHLDVLYGIDNPLFKDLKRDTKYIFGKLLPWLPKFILTVNKINRLNKPIETYLEKLITNHSLRDVITQHFFKGTPTFFAMSYFSLYIDYFYPIGGVDRLSAVLVDKIHEFNGELKADTTITEVNAAKRFVLDQKGEKYFYNSLIWAADLKAFYRNTLIEDLDAPIQENFKAKKQEVMAGKGSESVFSLCLEVNLPLSYFAEIAHGHFFYTPSKVGLGNLHREELKSLLKNWDSINKSEIYAWLESFLKFNTFEISIPGLKDETLVPKGKTGLIVSFIVEYELFKKVKESAWYDEFIDEIESKIILILSNSVYPKLSSYIERHFSFTPINIENRIGNTDGAIVGWSFEEKIPAVNKIQYSDKSVLTSIPNIFQAGQWAYSPAGVPMAILTGKLAADRVCKLKANNSSSLSSDIKNAAKFGG